MNKQVKEWHNFDGGSVSLLTDNITIVKYDVKKVITLENILSLKSVREKIIGDKNYHTITDVTSGLLNMNKAAKEYIANDKYSASNRLSDSIIVNGITKRIEVSTYIKIFKPKVKTKVFTSIEKSLEWIKSLEKESVQS